MHAHTATAQDEDKTRCEKAVEEGGEVSQTLDTCRQELTAPLSRESKIDALEAIGKVYLSQNEMNLAISSWREASQYTTPIRTEPVKVDRWARLQVLIGQTYSQSGKNEEAEKQFLDTLGVVEPMLGKYSLPTAVVRDSLGTLYALNGKKEEALNNFQRSRIIHEIRLGKLHPRTIEARLNKAVGLLDLKMENEAYEEFDTLAKIINPLPEYDEKPMKAEVLTFLGTLQMRNNEVLKAAQNYQTAFEVRSKVFGPSDIRTSQSLNNLGVVLYRAGDLVRSEKALSRAYVIRREKLGAEDPLTLSSQKNLQAVIEAQKASGQTPTQLN